MSDEDDLLKQLEKLRVASASSSKVDSTVDDKINYDKRERMMTGLYLIKNGLIKGLARAQGSFGKPLVRSHLSQLPPHKLIQEVEYGEARLSLSFVVGRSKDFGEVDNQYDRMLTYEEFTSRFEIQVTAVGEGRLDDKLDQQPNLLVHGVMGLSGELLGRLSIDPKKGETYAMLERLMSLGEEDAEGKVAQINLAEQLKQAFEPSGRYAKPSTSEIALVTPIPPSSDIADGIIPTPKKNGNISGIDRIRRTAKPSTSEIALGTLIPPSSDIADGIIPTPKKNGNISEVGKIRRTAKSSTPETTTSTPLHDSLGIVGYTLTDRIASDMGYEKETRGVLVIGVLENSIAEKAGLRAGTTPAEFGGTYGMLGGDIIIGVEDKTINKLEDFMEYISHYHTPGTRIRLRVIRNRELVEVTLVY